MGRTTVDVRSEARAAGIDDHEALDLAAVERRRQQVWVFVGVALVVTSSAVAASAVFPGLADRMVVDPKYLQLSLPALCLAFAAYGFDKERSLRRVTGAVIHEEISREQLRVQASQLRAALDAGKRLAASLQPDDVVEALIDAALELTDATDGTVVLADEQGGLEVVTTRGDARGTHIHHETIEMVALTRVPVRVAPDASAAESEAGPIERSALVVPLAGPEGILGVVVVSEPEARSFTDQDLSIVGCFADFAASALVNARRFQEERASSERLAAIESVRNEFTWLSPGAAE